MLVSIKNQTVAKSGNLRGSGISLREFLPLTLVAFLKDRRMQNSEY